MKKDEYLNKISQGLKQYDQTYVQEILDDYEEHFQDALSQGQSEEEICQALGDPADLIQEIKNMMDGVDSSQALARPVIEVEKSTKQSHSQKKRYSWSSSAQDGFTLKNIRFRADSADVRLVPQPPEIFMFILKIRKRWKIWNIPGRATLTKGGYDETAPSHFSVWRSFMISSAARWILSSSLSPKALTTYGLRQSAAIFLQRI